MSGDYYTMDIQGVSPERKAEIEPEFLAALVKFLGLDDGFNTGKAWTLDDIHELELRFDHEEYEALTVQWPDAVFRMQWSGDEDGGWPAAIWSQNGRLLWVWSSYEEMPDECPGDRDVDEDTGGFLRAVSGCAEAVEALREYYGQEFVDCWFGGGAA